MGRRNRHAKSVRDLLFRVRDNRLGREIYAAEIGIFEGTTSRFLLEQIPELYLIMVDPWLRFDEYLASGDKTANRSQVQFDEMAERARMLTDNYSDRRMILRLTSAKAVHNCRFRLDLCFLDGNHADIGKDIDLWWPKVRSGGILCGHDYGSGRCNRMIKPTVDEWAAKTGQTIEVLPGKVFWTRKPT